MENNNRDPCSSSLTYAKCSDRHNSIVATSDDYTPGTKEPNVPSKPPCLLEVFRIKINRNPRARSVRKKTELKGHIAGSVFARSWSIVEMYNQDKQPIIKDECDLLLTGPHLYFISATDPATIYLNLLIHKNDEEHLEDIITSVFWSHDRRKSTYNNQPLREVIMGLSAQFTATLFYAVFPLAVHAIVQVTLIDQRNPVVGVYGLIAASNDLFSSERDYDDFESVFFLKGSNDSIEVTTGHSILLSRSTIAVPLNWNLVVRVVLHRQGKRQQNSIYIHPTKISFPAKTDGVSLKDIDDKIRVTVTWNTKFKFQL